MSELGEGPEPNTSPEENKSPKDSQVSASNPNNVNTRADGSNRVFEEPQPWWKKILGKKTATTAATVVGLAAAGGAATYDVTHEGIIVDAKNTVANSIEVARNPRPYDGVEIQPGVITTANLVSLPPIGEGQKARDPVIRTSPKDDIGNVLDAEKIQKYLIDLKGVFTGKEILGGAYDNQAREDLGKFREENGVPYGKWFKFEAKDDKGETVELYVADTFVSPISQTSSVATEIAAK